MTHGSIRCGKKEAAAEKDKEKTVRIIYIIC